MKGEVIAAEIRKFGKFRPSEILKKMKQDTFEVNDITISYIIAGKVAEI